jgi:hypothetical protein
VYAGLAVASALIHTRRRYFAEQYEGQSGFPGEFLLRFQKSVYASDSFVFHRVH